MRGRGAMERDEAGRGGSEGGGGGGSDMASGCAGSEERREFSGLLTGLRIRKTYLRGLAWGRTRSRLCVPRWRRAREKEMAGLHGRGAWRREEGDHYTRSTADTARISQQRCPNPCPTNHESFNLCFTSKEIVQANLSPNTFVLDHF